MAYGVIHHPRKTSHPCRPNQRHQSRRLPPRRTQSFLPKPDEQLKLIAEDNNTWSKQTTQLPTHTFLVVLEFFEWKKALYRRYGCQLLRWKIALSCQGQADSSKKNLQADEKADQVPGILHVGNGKVVYGSFAPYTPERLATIGKYSQCSKCTVSEENKNSLFKSLLSPFPCLSWLFKLFLNYAENLKNGNNYL